MDKNTEIKQRMQEALQEIVSFDKEINETNIDSFIDILILALGSLFGKNIRNELENAVSQDNKIGYKSLALQDKITLVNELRNILKPVISDVIQKK